MPIKPENERDEIDAIVKNLDDYLDRFGGCVIVSTWAARMLEKYHPNVPIHWVTNWQSEIRPGINAIREQ